MKKLLFIVCIFNILFSCNEIQKKTNNSVIYPETLKKEVYNIIDQQLIKYEN